MEANRLILGTSVMLPYQSIAELACALRAACSVVSSKFVWLSTYLSPEKHSAIAVHDLPPGDVLTVENAAVCRNTAANTTTAPP